MGKILNLTALFNFRGVFLVVINICHSDCIEGIFGFVIGFG